MDKVYTGFKKLATVSKNKIRYRTNCAYSTRQSILTQKYFILVILK